MRIGIIAEGTQDQKVIRNILRACNIDNSDIIDIKPSNQTDETDKNNPTIGTFQGVKNACEGKRPNFKKFFIFEGENFMVIHLDTAEIEQQNFIFQKPTKTNNPDYCAKLRQDIITLINTWLENNYVDNLLYAIAIEETEAWLLAKFENNTEDSANPKAKLEYKMKSITKADIIDEMRKMKGLKPFLANNESLKAFVESIQKLNINQS